MEEFCDQPLTEEINYTAHFEGIEGKQKIIWKYSRLNSLNP